MISQVDLLLVGQLDAEALLGGGGEQVPVVVQRRVDVDGDAHGRSVRYDVRRRCAEHWPRAALTRAGPRPTTTTADGDDSTWLDVDWRAHQRWETGRRRGRST